MHRHVRRDGHRDVQFLIAVALAVISALALAACGGGGGGGSTEGADVVVESVDGLEFRPEETTAEAGQITIAMVNEDSQRHTLAIDEARFKIDAAAGNTASDTVTLEAGTYTYYCDVPGHREAGMEGTLEVQ